MAAGAAFLSMFAGAAGSVPGPALGGPPQRDHGRGQWFAHTCAQAPNGFASCGAQVVTSSAGLPLASGSPPASAYGPAEFLTAYGLPQPPQAAPATVPTIAIVDAYDDPNIASDVASFDSYSQYGLPALNSYSQSSPSPWFRKVNQTGGTTYPAGNSGWGLEISLDVETVHEICQYCNILLVEANSNSFGDLGTAENYAAANASIVTNSWGGGDSSSDTSLDSYFNHPGHVITASTGDSGYGVEYPASSQYVIGVGGTTLTLGANKSYGSESAWADGGSGCSRYEPKPSWQHDSGCSHKTVADVSADADPNTGAAVYDTYGYGGWLQVGGTSLASPLIAAVYALAGNTTNPGAPYGDTSALHDVLTGSNGSCGGSYLCTAGPGYDGPTGWGTPNGLAAFTGTPPPPGYSLSATPSSQTVTAGGGTSYTVTVTPSGGFTGTVNVSGTSTPSGPNVGSSSCTISSTAPCTATVNASTSTSTAGGSYTLTFTGTSGSLSNTTTATLIVQVPDFSLTVSPSSRTLRTPGSTTYTVTVHASGGFSSAVTFSASGLPSGLTASFSPYNPTNSTATLTLSATSRLSRGTHTITVKGVSGSLTHTVNATLSLR